MPAFLRPLLPFTLFAALCVGLLFLLPGHCARAILPPVVYIQPAINALFTIAGPLSIARTSRRPLTAFLAQLALFVLLVPLAVRSLIAVSGITAGIGVVMLIVATMLAAVAGAGVALNDCTERYRPPCRRARLAIGVFALFPILGYVGVIEHSALLYLPGGGPFALLSLALGHPLEWAVFRVAWISGILYAALGLIVGIVAIVMRAGNLRSTGD